MKAASLKEIKTELKQESPEKLVELVLRLSRFKKENKELLTYLLFESSYEAGFIESIKANIDSQFETINTKNYYWVKKGVRKILKETIKFIRYSQNKETEVELLLYFCEKLKELNPPIKRNTTLSNLYVRQLDYIKRKVEKLHEDLQYDYQIELKELEL